MRHASGAFSSITMFVIILAATSAIAEDSMDAIVPETDFIADPVESSMIPWWKISRLSETETEVAEEPLENSSTTATPPRHSAVVQVATQGEEKMGKSKGKAKKLNSTVNSLMAQVTKKVKRDPRDHFTIRRLKQVRKQQAGYRKKWDKVNTSAANKATYAKQIKAQKEMNIKAEKARQAWLDTKELGKKRAHAFEPPEPPPSGHYQSGTGSGSGRWVKGWVDPSLKDKLGKEGATVKAQQVTKDGHLMLGGNRRRIGSGFSPVRRRRTPIPGATPSTPVPLKAIKQAVKGKSILKSLLPKKKSGAMTQKERKVLLKSGAGLKPKVDSKGHFKKSTEDDIKANALSAAALKKKAAAAKAKALAAAAKLAKIEKDEKASAKLIGGKAAAAVKAAADKKAKEKVPADKKAKEPAL